MSKTVAVILVGLGGLFFGIAIAIMSMSGRTRNVGRRNLYVKISLASAAVGTACWMATVFFPPAQ